MSKDLNPNHKECKCGKKMIKWETGASKINECGRRELGITWKCACGNKEQLPPRVQKNDEELFLDEWRSANMPKPKSNEWCLT